MSLLKYNYYSISEAADELSKQLTETITSKDIVKQAREGRLAIAVSVAPNALCRYSKTINDTPSKIESEYEYGMLYEFLSEDHPRLDGYNFTLYISSGTLANDSEFDPLEKFISAKSGMDMNWVPMLKASPESSADITLLRSTEVQKWSNADKKGVSYDSTDIVSAPFIEYNEIQSFLSQQTNIQETVIFRINTPNRRDDWYDCIECFARDFFEENEEIPSESQLWNQLVSKHHTIWIIQKIKDGEQLILSGKSLDRENFHKRYIKYFT